MICPNCGRANADDARFCSFCGRDLAGPPPPPAPTQPTQPSLPFGMRASAFGSGWVQAARLGSWPFLIVGLVGQALAFLVYAADHLSSSNSQLGGVNTLRIGGLYFYGFHHVRITVSQATPEGGAFNGNATFAFAAALLVVTAFAAWLLYRAGRRLATELDGPISERVLHGAKVAVPYAVFSFVLSFILDFSTPDGGRITVGHLGAFLLPLLLGVIAGGIGGLSSARPELEARRAWGHRTAAAVAGGLRAFLLSLILAFVGLLVVAGVKPDATRAYVRTTTGSAAGAAALVHHVLALPNQSMWVLVPAMGGCDGIYGGTGPVSVRFDFLCYTHFPEPQGTTSVPGAAGGLFFGAGGEGPRLPFGFGTAPAGYFLFLLVPAISVLYGGASAARRAGSSTANQGAVAGTLAGLVFGAVVGLGSWLGGLGVQVGGGVFGATFRVHGTIGPRVIAGTLLGFAWGVVGCGIGGGVATLHRHRATSTATTEPE